MEKILISFYIHFFNFYNKKIMKVDGVEVRYEAIFAIAASLTFIVHNTLGLIFILFCVKLSKWISLSVFALFFYLLIIFFDKRIDKKFKIENLNFTILSWQIVLLYFILMLVYNFVAPIIWSELSEECNFLK